MSPNYEQDRNPDRICLNAEQPNDAPDEDFNDGDFEEERPNQYKIAADSEESSSAKILTIESGTRLDVGVTDQINKSRSFVQTLIEDGHVLVNGERKKANYKVRQGDVVEVRIPQARPLDVTPQNIPLEIIYEDDDVIVVNKPQGMVVHPAPGSWDGTLVNALLYHCRNLSGINGVLRPGIVHRIDKDTSGLLVVAKHDEAHQGLAAQIKAHSMKRQYLALVHGLIQEGSGTIDAPIGRDPSERKRMAVVFQNSKPAVTHYWVLERFAKFTFVRAQLETGRTHQIRVHLHYIDHPVVGDPLYGPKRNPFGLKGQLLHAANLGFIHPRTGEYLEFEAELPQLFVQTLDQLRGD